MVAASLDRLEPSSKDFQVLCETVEIKFNEVVNKFFRTNGEPPTIPEYVQKAMVRWREAILRHRQGDFRHTKSEELSVREVAQWTVDLNCSLTGNPIKKIEWSN
jgi:hypothetical protein